MTCEKFINKKGVERKDIFESRSTFISRAIKLAETLVTLRNKNFWIVILHHQQRVVLVSSFKKKETANSGNSSLATNTSSVTISRDVVMESSEPTHNISSTIISVNACLAIKNREKFLSEREIQMLKTFFMEIEVSYEQLFTSDVKNDQQLMQLFMTFIYKWDIFKNLQEQYHGAPQRNSRKSSIKLKIDNIEEAVDKLKQW